MGNVEDLVKSSLDLIGIKNPKINDLTTGLKFLNLLRESFGTSRNLIEAIVAENFPLTAAQSAYQIGEGATASGMVTTRPVRIENAYLKDTGGTDHKLEIIHRNDYNDIVSKTQGGRPKMMNYLTTWPVGLITFDLEPSIAYTLYLDSWKPFFEYDDLTTEVNVPPSHKVMMVFNLALYLAPVHSVAPQQYVTFEAGRTKRAVENLNQSPPESPKFDPAITGHIDTYWGC